MKRAGIIIFILGIILLIGVGVKSLKEKNEHINVEATKEPHPFPYAPLIGGVLVAGGIIMMSRNAKVKILK